MKEAVGYLTEDGKFFESMDEAEEYEAYCALCVQLHENCLVGTDEFLAMLASIPNETRRYINANEAATRYREIQASLSTKDTTGREVNNEAILEQPTSIDEPLPDMGHSIEQEKIRLERAVNGVGSGGVDASDVRRGADMAIGTYPGVAKTRNVHRASNIRKGKVE